MKRSTFVNCADPSLELRTDKCWRRVYSWEWKCYCGKTADSNSETVLSIMQECVYSALWIINVLAVNLSSHRRQKGLLELCPERDSLRCLMESSNDESHTSANGISVDGSNLSFKFTSEECLYLPPTPDSTMMPTEFAQGLEESLQLFKWMLQLSKVQDMQFCSEGSEPSSCMANQTVAWITVFLQPYIFPTTAPFQWTRQSVW